jgi:hypothetical protein
MDVAADHGFDAGLSYPVPKALPGRPRDEP